MPSFKGGRQLRVRLNRNGIRRHSYKHLRRIPLCAARNAPVNAAGPEGRKEPEVVEPSLQDSVGSIGTTAGW